MTKIKRILLVLLSLCMILSATACGDTGRTQNKGGTKTVTCWIQGNETEVANYKKIVNDFNTLHEEDKWFIDVSTPVNYYDSLSRSFGANGNPDMFMLEIGEFSNYVESGLLKGLDEYMNSSTSVLKKSDLWDINNSHYRYDSNSGIYGTGDLYCIIKDWSPDFMLVYNKDMLQEYNQANGTNYVIPEDRPLTWDEFFDIAVALTVRNGDKVDRYGTSLAFESTKHLLEFVQMTGKSFYSDDYSSLNVNDPDVKSAMKYWADLQKSENAPAQYTVGSVGGDEIVSFKSKKCFSVWCGLWTFTAKGIYDVDFNYGVAYPPVPSKTSERWPVSNPYETYATTSAMMGHSVAYNCKYPEVAYEFIDFYMTQGTENYLLDIGFNIPGNKTLAASDKFLNTNDPKVAQLNKYFYNFAVDPNNHVLPTEFSKKCSFQQFQAATSLSFTRFLGGNSYAFDDFVSDIKNDYESLVVEIG